MVATQRPAWARAGLYLTLMAGLIAIASLDRLTGDAVDLSIFYALVVLSAAWFGGLAAGLLAALTATITHFHADAEIYALRGIDAAVILNEVQRAALLAAVAWLAARERQRVALVAAQRDELVAAQQHIRTTMEAARRVQKGLLSYDIPSDGRVDMAVQWATSMLLGGDFHDLQQEGDRLYICVADVSGKGPPAALVTGLLRGLLESLDRDRPAELLTRLNRQLTPYLPSAMFVTCFYGVYSLSTRILTYASAGHDPGLLVHGQDVRDLGATGIPLGIDDEPYEERTTQMDRDDTLLLYTDGLTNARVDAERRLGDDILRHTLRTHRGDCRSLLSRLFTLAPELRSGTQEDDVVVVGMRVR